MSYYCVDKKRNEILVKKDFNIEFAKFLNYALITKHQFYLSIKPIKANVLETLLNYEDGYLIFNSKVIPINEFISGKQNLFFLRNNQNNPYPYNQISFEKFLLGMGDFRTSRSIFLKSLSKLPQPHRKKVP